MRSRPFSKQVRVVPVLTIERVSDAVPLARALVRGGLWVSEVTLRTPAALGAAPAIRQVGCPIACWASAPCSRQGELRRRARRRRAFCGHAWDDARLCCGVARNEHPGAARLCGKTVSEAMALARAGFEVLKFFPAEAAGGRSWLQAVAGPLPTLKFCPTGGIGPHNAASYLAFGNVLAVGGSWPAPTEAIEAGRTSAR